MLIKYWYSNCTVNVHLKVNFSWNGVWKKEYKRKAPSARNSPKMSLGYIPCKSFLNVTATSYVPIQVRETNKPIV